jgi:hypothetical protein
MTESPTGQAQQQAQAPVSFRLSIYWKLLKGQAGITRRDSRRLALSEVLDFLLTQLSGEEATVQDDGARTVITIDWRKVPMEIRDPFSFGVRR